jgi:hypothetical protein
MQYDVLGKNVKLEQKIGEDWFPLLCAKEVGLSYNQDKIETTNVNSGRNREYVPGMSNASLSITGVTHINSGNGRIPVGFVIENAASINTYRLTLTDNNTSPNQMVVTAQGFLETANITGPRGGLSNSSLSIALTGGLEFSESVEPPGEPVCDIADTLYIDAVAGANTVHSEDLEAPIGFNVVVLLVSRSGDVYTSTTGTPTNMQYSFNQATGIITFDAGRPFEAGEVVTVLYKVVTSIDV